MSCIPMMVRSIIYKLIYDYGIWELEDFLHAPYRVLKAIALHLETMAMLGNLREECLEDIGCARIVADMDRELLEVEPYEVMVEPSDIVRLYRS